MKKITALILVLTLALVFAACGKTETPTTTPAASTPAATESAEPTNEDAAEKLLDVIPFANDGELYFDIKVGDAIKDFAAKVDGEAVPASGGAVKYTENSKLEFTGTGDADKSVNVYIIMATKESGKYSCTQSIQKGLDADVVLERLPNTISRVLAGTAKVYVAITQDPKGWDHNLDEKLNAFLDPLSN